MNISRMNTEQLGKAIEGGKFGPDLLEQAKTVYAKRIAGRAGKDLKSATPPAEEEKEEKPLVEPEVKSDEDVHAIQDEIDEAVGEEPLPQISEELVEEPKEEKPKKEKKEKSKEKEPKPEGFKPGSIREFVANMIVPTGEETTAASTFGEVNAAVLKKFGRNLHRSEFDGVYKALVQQNKVTGKKQIKHESTAKDTNVPND